MSEYFDLAFSSPRHYLSQKFPYIISDNDLPLEENARGIITPVGIILLLIRLTVPLAHTYITLILLRELIFYTLQPLDTIISTTTTTTPLTFYQIIFTTYLPSHFLTNLLPPKIPRHYDYSTLSRPPLVIEYWLILEVLFYLTQKLHIHYLQHHTDPIEASLLSAAPLLESSERCKLFRQVMHQIDPRVVGEDQGEDDDAYDSGDDVLCVDSGGGGGGPINFIRGWFFDESLDGITKYDMSDFLAWSMFEGRNQEHLTDEEVGQLKVFLEEFEWRLSFHLYGGTRTEEVGVGGDSIGSGEEQESGVVGLDRRRMNLTCPRGEYLLFEEEVEEEILLRDQHSDILAAAPMSSLFVNKHVLEWNEDPNKRSKPWKDFHFRETIHESTPHHLLPNIYEALTKRFSSSPVTMIHSPNLHSIRTYVSLKRRQLHHAEEQTIKRTRLAASNAYDCLLHHVLPPHKINNNSNITYKNFLIPKRLQAIGKGAHSRLDEAWASVCKMKERLELQRQLEVYRNLLARMRGMSAAVSTRQLAELLRKITECNEKLVQVERSALVAFWKATGSAGKTLLTGMRVVGKGGAEPQRYAKYSNDPLLGLATYPLAFHLALYALTDGLLRVLLRKRGFRRLTVKSTTYYYHPGVDSMNAFDEGASTKTTNAHVDNNIPLVFCHGIGIGLIYYLCLIDELLQLGKPVFLPEIPYVCGFRPWLSRNSILTPTAATSTLTAMLASRGFLKATFLGHSYGTSWLSYMCKYASHAVSAVIFLDPICFCLHHPDLTKSFVYHRADPGSISYMIKTDLIINWTIQRSISWSRIVLFIEDIPNDIPYGVYLSEKDVLVPVGIVEGYFRRNGVKIVDFQEGDNVGGGVGIEEPLSVVVFRGDAHGDWSARRSAAVHIANTTRMLTMQCEQIKE